MPADSFVATTHLRFIERDLGHQRTGRILQQQWIASGTLWAADLNDSNSEWRDVPLVETKKPEVVEEITLSEAATKAWNEPGKARFIGADWAADMPEAKTSPEVMRRRQMGLPDYEKPPLGQPPAFLQEQEPKSREETVQEERLARVDVSLAKQLQNAIENNGRLVKTLAEVKARLPAGMQSCTIVFEECPKGHDSLRATNWVKGPCLHCRIQKQQDALRWICQQASSGHRENLKNVAKEGLEP